MEAIGLLAGGVAHDFNNVLSIILSYCDLIREGLEADDPMLEDVGEIGKAARRAADLTSQLLAFSRQQVTEPRVFDLNQALAHLDKMLRRVLGEDVALSLVPSRSAAKICADQVQIEQVVMNLVVNARDAMPKGGKLTIEVTEVLLDDAYAREHLGTTPGAYVMLAVTDTGTGMDKATQARIFEPFFTTKAVGRGTGLGLATAHGIVRQAGGSIWVYSEVGKGTTFKVYLPSARDAAITQAPPPAQSTLRGSETVLLVEDDEQLRAVTRSVLAKHGYRVLEADGVDSAIAKARRHRGKIHLLLTDVVMPGGSGVDLTARLSAARPGMRVLCMSGYASDAMVRHGIMEAGTPFLQKPITRWCNNVCV